MAPPLVWMPLYSICTPRLVAFPLVPTIVIGPVPVASTHPLLPMRTPILLPVPVPPVPVMLMAPFWLMTVPPSTRTPRLALLPPLPPWP